MGHGAIPQQRRKQPGLFSGIDEEHAPPVTGKSSNILTATVIGDRVAVVTAWERTHIVTIARKKLLLGLTMAEPMSSILEVPGYWRSRAAQSRATADEMEYPGAKCAMLGIAAGYDHLALRAEARIAEKGARKKPPCPSPARRPA